MLKRTQLLCFLLLYTGYGIAQSSDILRAEYTVLPRNNSEVEIARYRFLVNVPIKLAEDKYLVTGADYNLIDFDGSRNYPFDASELNVLHIIDLNLGYIFKLNEQWRGVGIFTPRLASNFTDGIVGRDLKINLAATIWKEKKDVAKPFRIVLGLSYNSATGLPIPLPVVSYYKRFHEKWSYSLGIPKSSFRHHLTDRHMLQTALFLDGYFVNIQNDILLADNNLGSAISLSALVGVLGYQYNINKNMSFYTQAGFTITQRGLLRDDKRNNVFVLSDVGNFYFRTGFKISIF
ncbi:MAG: DUF6268 family outer membrane beta-barrel protein [Flavobacteriaceae bacterium]